MTPASVTRPSTAALIKYFLSVYLFVVIPVPWFGRFIGLVALGIISRFKVPEPVLIGAGAAAGRIIFALRA
jgi:hypothetical protein